MMNRSVVALLALGIVACGPRQAPVVQPAPDPGAATRASGPSVTTPPEPGPLRSWQFPEIREFTLANGMRVIHVERSMIPIVTARVMFDAGGIREPAEKSGLASLTGSLLREGTSTLGGAEITSRMEGMGAQLATVGTFSMAYIDVTSLPEVFAEALALAATTVTEPTFPANEFQRVRGQAVANYHQTMARVEGIANRAFWRAAFQPEGPWSRSSDGTATTLQALTRDDVVQWHRTRYAPSNATVIIVGAINESRARQVLERAFAGWTASARREPVPASPPTARTGPRIVLVDRPGSVQSAIIVGQAAPGATSPDYLPLVAATHVLGGAVSSRLNANLRERHGYTYGAFSNLDIRRGGAALLMSSSVRTSATDSALVEALAEYRRIVSDPIPPDELRGMVNNLVSSFPSSAQTVQELRTRLQNLELWGLPLDFYATYRERLSALGAQQVQQALGRHLTADRPLVVIAGDLSRIEAPIRARNLGQVEVWDSEGNPVR